MRQVRAHSLLSLLVNAFPAQKQGASCRQAAINFCHVLPLVGLAKSKKDPINRGKVLVNIQLENMDHVSALKMHALLSVWPVIIGNPSQYLSSSLPIFSALKSQQSKTSSRGQHCRVMANTRKRWLLHPYLDVDVILATLWTAVSDHDRERARIGILVAPPLQPTTALPTSSHVCYQIQRCCFMCFAAHETVLGGLGPGPFANL